MTVASGVAIEVGKLHFLLFYFEVLILKYTHIIGMEGGAVIGKIFLKFSIYFLKNFGTRNRNLFF